METIWELVLPCNMSGMRSSPLGCPLSAKDKRSTWSSPLLWRNEMSLHHCYHADTRTANRKLKQNKQKWTNHKNVQVLIEEKKITHHTTKKIAYRMKNDNRNLALREKSYYNRLAGIFKAAMIKMLMGNYKHTWNKQKYRKHLYINKRLKRNNQANYRPQNKNEPEQCPCWTWQSRFSTKNPHDQQRESVLRLSPDFYIYAVANGLSLSDKINKYV